MRKLFALFEKKIFWTLGRKFLEPSCDGCLLFRFFFQVSKAKVFSNFLVRKVAELSESIFFDLAGSKIVLIFLVELFGE